MRRVMTALVPVVASLASLSLVACGNDGSTVDVGAAPVTSVDALLIDSLPELTGPTVLWFWAPG